ncbi:MAG: hypothetical protein ACREUZ_19630 [Burkholderiales bacterium]
MTRGVRLALSIGLIVLALWLYDSLRPVPQPPGVLAPDAPRVELVEGKSEVFEHDGHVLTALARFSAQARVLSVKRYGDRAAQVAPRDIALGWGPMSDSTTLKLVDVAQTERGVVFQSFDPKLPDEQVAAYVLNLHVVAADGELRKRLGELRAGNVVRIEGWLVEAVAGDGWRWRGTARDGAPTMPATLLWLEKLEVS